MVLTYEEVLEHYRRLLKGWPVKAALDIGRGHAAILVNDQVCGLVGADDGCFVLYEDEVYNFDRSAFLEEGCWDGETPEETRAAIENPRFVGLINPPETPEKPAPALTPTDELVSMMKAGSIYTLTELEARAIRDCTGAGEELDRHGWVTGTTRVWLSNQHTYLIQNPYKHREGWIIGYTPKEGESKVLIQVSQIVSIQFTD